MSIDDPGLQKIYAACAEFNLPVLFHGDHLICSDEPGAPRLERMLQDFPDTIFIGHATRFWAEISQNADLDPVRLAQYPSGPVSPTGPTDRLLGQYPNLYGDLSTMTWVIPRSAFHTYLKALIQAGLGKRLMFGSDQMRWPEMIGKAIEAIETADFLTAEQKRDIFYNNAARFLRLGDASAGRRER